MDNRVDSDEDNIRDFNLIKRYLSDASTTVSEVSSVTTLFSNRQADDIEVWPLQLNTQFVDHYIFGDIIGRGSYAEVHECIDTRSLERCAVKIIDKSHLIRQNPAALKSQEQEIRLLRRLDHRNLIAMRECLYKGPKIYIVLEHCTFVLSDLLTATADDSKKGAPNSGLSGGRPVFSDALTRNLFSQIMAGIHYLHSKGIVHRDIKPHNMLITTCGTLKIIDLGVSQVLSVWVQSDRCNNYEGSPLFQAPEIVSGQLEYSGFKIDIWAAGVTLYLMLFGDYPFKDDSLLALYDKIMGDDFIIPESAHSNLVILDDLLGLMLNKSSDERASTETVINHQWLKYQDHGHEPGDDSHSEFIELTQDPTHSSLTSDGQFKTDVYRSMTVLPYLHAHHFPQNLTTKARRPGSRGSSQQSSPASTRSSLTSTTSSSSSKASSISSGSSTNTTADPSEIDPHMMIEDEPVEWGTKNQYKLLKVPIIRANRIKHFRRRRHRRKARDHATRGTRRGTMKDDST